MNRVINFVSVIISIIASSAPYIAQAASTPSATGPKSAALLDLQSRIIALKKSASQAIKDTGLGEAIKIGGYLNTLSGLEVASISSYPVAELSFYLANLGLCQNIVNLVSQILYVAGNSVSLSGNLISLQLARQNCPTCPLLGDPRNLTDSQYPQKSPKENIYMSSFQSVMDNLDPATLARMISASQASSYDIAQIFVLNGGVSKLITLSTDLLSANAKAFQNISQSTASAASH